MMEKYNIRAILDLNLINKRGKLNLYFKAINNLLPDAGLYITCFESHRQRNFRVYGSNPALTDKLRILLGYLVHRVIPKIAHLKKTYYFFLKKPYRYLPTSEALGRLIYCGFTIIEYRVIRNRTYCVLMKTSKPLPIKHPNYGVIIKLKRVGKEGKMLDVYKFRTMHAYSEYLQDYLVKHNGYSGKGKLANDFRITYYGRFFRKFWLDELPQLINVLKNEMKLVGVRPISITKFSEMPADLRALRIKHKPGCIPPYVSLNDPSKEGNERSERTYLKDKAESSFVDLRYLCKALYNMFVKRMCSE
jgi:lipopolysaccharide/colanic/teichoic acid biosynthesis glycosyltransferase